MFPEQRVARFNDDGQEATLAWPQPPHPPGPVDDEWALGDDRHGREAAFGGDKAVGEGSISGAGRSAPRLAAVVRLDGPGRDLQWLQEAFDQQRLLFQAAQQERQLAMSALVNIAQALCQKALDDTLRAGEEIERWTPGRLAEWIVNEVSRSVRLARLAVDPDKAAQFDRAELEIARLTQEASTQRKRAEGAERYSRLLKQEIEALKAKKKTPAAGEKARPAGT